ncbi:MAG: carbamate kinase [Bacteroidota bacterium]|nr:carbamate kinase [Bacteroidota bacterium]
MIAIGGNSLIRAGQKGTIPEQFANARLTTEQIAVLAEEGCRIVITHGNGPQVGSQLLRSEAGSSQTYTLPLDVCVAMTQGEIGYIIQTSLQSIFRERKISIPVTSLITQVLVDKHDPAFQNPTKPIGPFYSKEVAQKKQDELNWNIIEDAARGYRRVVPSPKPLEVIEQDIILDCLERGIIVIASGGGGIPVTFENGTMVGVEAVIDKDRASALLAIELNIERFIISTEVEKVYLNFKKSNQKAIDMISLDEAKRYLDEGHFLEGSMKPKIEAAIEFLESGGEEVIITNPEHLADAIKGKTGTHIIGRIQR